ncbi:hypothetical protein [Rhizohabitans arisaemae]|uniref:hypothetical protein n=1 Tax=Rhizohabitans arisaemae TaxID=2720610 RepID=UPI0024B0A17C|nr:hypothetical protein [Rhizohabitans arisaemae]
MLRRVVALLFAAVMSFGVVAVTAGPAAANPPNDTTLVPRTLGDICKSLVDSRSYIGLYRGGSSVPCYRIQNSVPIQVGQIGTRTACEYGNTSVMRGYRQGPGQALICEYYTDVFETTYSPVSVGEYCRAQVNPQSSVGLYRGNAIECYNWPTHVGNGTPTAACQYFASFGNHTVLGAWAGGSESLVCRFAR